MASRALGVQVKRAAITATCIALFLLIAWVGMIVAANYGIDISPRDVKL
jgi:hypothetical protein